MEAATTQLYQTATAKQLAHVLDTHFPPQTPDDIRAMFALGQAEALSWAQEAGFMAADKAVNDAGATPTAPGGR